MVFHRKPWFGGEGFLDHAYLAVDFFFALSGFVIAEAYGQKLGRGLGVWDFTMRRVIRLFPLAMLGVALGIVMAIGRYLKEGTLAIDSPVATALLNFALVPALWQDKPWPYDPPLWSIFFEMLINIVFAAAALWLTRDRLLRVIGVAALCLAAAGLKEGDLGIGHAAVNFYGGFFRVGFSFLMGVYLHGVHTSGLTRGWRGGTLTPLLLVATFLVPNTFNLGGAYDLAVVMVVYPAMILAAAEVRWARSRWAEISGQLSYPLYALHEPALFGASAALMLIGLGAEQPGIPMAIARFIGVALLSWVALKLFDEPVRAWLTRRSLRAGARRPVAPGV